MSAGRAISSDPDNSTTRLKSELRAAIRMRRKQLDAAARIAHDAAINQHVIEFIETTRADSLAFFWAFDGEPDLRPAMHHLAAAEKRIVLPVLTGETRQAHMEFRQWRPGASLTPNVFGIPEPLEGKPVGVNQLDVVFIPLVGWDAAGRRLGMGAGYYDRALQAVAALQRPLRAGIAYDLQRTEGIPVQQWDIPLHQLITESGRINCRGLPGLSDPRQ